VTEDLLVERDDHEAVAAVAVRVPLRGAGRVGAHLLPGRFEAGAGRQPADDGQEVEALLVGSLPEVEGHPDVGRLREARIGGVQALGEAEVLRQDADDLVLPRPDRQDLADGARFAGQVALPEAVGDHQDRWCVRLLVSGRQGAAVDRPRSEHAEDRSCHRHQLDALGLTRRSGHGRRVEDEGRGRIEAAGELIQIGERAGGERDPVLILPRLLGYRGPS
jgi:hypothetical protein